MIFNHKVTKAWANDLTKQLKSSFEKISSAVNSLNANFVIFAQKFDNLEVSLRHEVTAAASAASLQVPWLMRTKLLLNS